jgi:thymidylate synthase (FAD)
MSLSVELIDHMGSDLSVVNAARVSFAKESEWDIVLHDDALDSWDTKEVLSDRDQKLIKYLAKHNHWTPFGHCFASFRIKAPIFVARQLGKHQVGLVWNEVSRRYVDDVPEFYTPETWRARAPSVKQGSSEEAIKGVEPVYENFIKDIYWLYNAMLSNGVCPEQARMVLPQSMYTEWVWSGSLAAWARVYNLRTDPHTQSETRTIAHAIGNELRSLYPYSWEALTCTSS